MLIKIIEKELLDTITGPRFIAIFLVCTLLIMLSVYTGVKNYVNNLNFYTTATSVMKETIESQVSYAALGYWGQYKVYKEPSPLSVIANGLEDDIGRGTHIALFEEPAFADNKHNETPIFAVFGVVDMAFVVKIILSLFAILFTFDSICGERERGTLKLMLASAVPRDKIIIGKLIGNAASLIVPLLLALGIGIFVILIHPRITIEGDDWINLLLILFLFLLYMKTFLAMGMFVSARTRKSSTSFLLLLVLWVLFVLVIPKTSVMLSGYAVHVPTSAEIEAKKQALGRERLREYRDMMAEWRKNNPDERRVPEDAREEFRKILDDKYKPQIEKLDNDYTQKKKRQEALTMWVSRLSPASALTFATINLAHTGIDHHRRFLQAAERHKEDFDRYVTEKIKEDRKRSSGSHWMPFTKGKLDVSDMPQFRSYNEPLGSILPRIAVDIALLFAFAMLFVVGAYVSFLRYDVR